MSRNKAMGMCMLLVALATTATQAWAQGNKPTPLGDTGKSLEAKYSAILLALKQEIKQQLPEVNAAAVDAYMQAREAEAAAKSQLDGAQQNRGKVGAAQALVNHATGKWIGGAKEGIKKAEAELKDAKTDAERKAAQVDLANCQKNLADGLAALKERQALLDKAKSEEPQAVKALEVAENAYAEAKVATMKAIHGLGLDAFLASDRLDAQLAKFVVLSEATPQGLAAFAATGAKQEALVEKLLADDALMLQMVFADGARDGKYGLAMQIYSDIQKLSRKASQGALQRLALAVSLEHAAPVGQRNPGADADAPKFVDPLQRYLHFEEAFLDGELDPAFKDLSVWDYRMVVDGEEPDAILAWGREMLRAYRPDHITTPDYRWRYVASVRTDIQYGSQFNKYDKPELQFYQNILMNGGVCGRRAFFGRFILRAFGIPTTARPQRGHAALAHWTPDGWVICLGAGWGSGWTKTRYDKDLDFLATTQARESSAAYMQVKRAQWIGDVVGERPVFGFLSGEPQFWYGLSLYTQRRIIQEIDAVALAAVGEELGEANESKVKYAIEYVELSEADKQIRVDNKGVITIPAAACSNPTKSTGKIIFMDSELGGKQLHYSRTGNAQSFEYTFDAPRAGTYALTARVAVPSWGQVLRVVANGDPTPVDIALPLTVGLWGETAPVEISLKRGKNVLSFSRVGDNIRGLTIKDFTLTPAVK